MGWLPGKKDGCYDFRILKNMVENLFPVILFFYPLRHVSWGLDLMDTGYNYANHLYMGLEHMDPMWLFSTWLSNAAGHLLTLLPGGDRLMGMNIYTGLTVSILALAGYWFCTKKLRIHAWAAFLGEMAAISLCWCPTALLYNYITYVLFLACFILLYLGLTKDEKGYLIAAGVCLGTNVFVRFSNLPEAAMILAVWVYDFAWAREEKMSVGRAAADFGSSAGAAESGSGAGTGVAESFRRKALRHTLWCLAGYLAALAVLLGYIHIRYGLGEYAAGLSRLFAMTETAPNYRAVDMVMGILRDYTDHLYWVIRMGIFLAGGMAAYVLAGLAGKRMPVSLGRVVPAVRVFPGAAAAAAMTAWLYRRGAEGLGAAFCTLDFYDYSSIRRPGILFLMLTLFIAAVRVVHPRSGKEERLAGSMLILVLFLTSIGSNNRTFPSMNNLFIAAPYTLEACWKFLAGRRDKKISHVIIPLFPIKCILAAFLLICGLQFGGFGLCFVFAEAAGVRDISATVDNNEVLEGVRMSKEKAEWLSSVSSFVNENGLKGREVILYGTPLGRSIPSLSYYLQMPSAFNPWINLPSYSYAAMEAAMRELDGRPVIILEYVSALCAEREGIAAGTGGVVSGNAEAAGAETGAGTVDGRSEAAAGAEGSAGAKTGDGVEEAAVQEAAQDIKLQLILKFMRENGYVQTFRNEKFAIYQ